MGRRPPAVRHRGHIAVDQRVHEQWIVQERELVGQLVPQAALLGFQQGVRVVRHQPDDPPVRRVCVPQIAGSVQRMESGVDK